MKKGLLFTFFAILLVGRLAAQSRDIMGQVSDDSGALLGVTVVVEGTTKGVVTDIDGNFTIPNVEPSATLSFSYVGYETKSVPVGTDSMLNVKMSPSTTELDEVVVVGYGTQRRSDISTAVSSVSIEEIANSGSSQALQAMQGKISGVDITSNDGSMTSGMTFKIRGVNSITGGTQPLFVIDGFPITPDETSSTESSVNPLMGLNPSDIESMEVLKDAAAAAIYGASGSNGVVIINTKKGNYGSKAKISLNYTYGVDVMAPNNLEVLDPEDYAYKMLNYSTSSNNASQIDFWNKVISDKGWNNPNTMVWMDELTQIGQKHEVNASISGGSDGTNYMFSMGYLDNDGVIRRTSFDRFTSRLNLQHKITDKLTFEVNASFSRSDDTNPLTDSSSNGVILNALMRSPYLYYPDFMDLYSSTYTDAESNSPLVAVDEVNINNKYVDFTGKAMLSYKLTNDITLSTNYSYRTNRVSSDKFWGQNTWFGKSESGRMELAEKDVANWVYEARAQWNKRIGKSSYSAMGAFEASEYSRVSSYAKATGYEDTPNGIYGIEDGLITYAPDYDYESHTSLSYIARATYSYNNRYVVNASLRVDGSSKFNDDNRYGYFPAISTAWRASNEKFIKNLNAFSNLRVRASFGMTGNKQIPSYQSLAVLTSNKVVVDGNQTETGRYQGSLANEDLKWETQKQYNLGVDMGFAKNRFSFTADLYYKNIDDMLLQVNIPSTSGYKSAWQNAGKMMNKGVDLSLSANWFTGDFSWSTDFNFSAYRNEILALADGQYQQFYSRGLSEKVENDVLLQVGMPVGMYYGYVTDGVYNTAAEIANSPIDPNAALGELKVKDVNGDGKIDSNDRTIIGNVNPKHTGGIGNTLSYKGLDLYIFFRYSYGNDVINANAFSLTNYESLNNVLTSVADNVWSPNNPLNNGPLYGNSTWGSTVMTSDLVEDGSFLRLQTLTLGYTIPRKITNKLKVASMKVSLTGTNLWLLTGYDGFDPEANTGYGTIAQIAPGFDRSAYPRARTFSLSVGVGF